MTCEKCGATLEIGVYPFCPHPKPTVSEYRPFKEFFDIALGANITSLAQWNRTMRQKGAQLTDSMSKGDFNARKDKCEAIKRERAR